MMTFDFYNPAALPPTRTLLRVLRLTFHRRYSIVFAYNRDSIATRSARTRTGAFEAELYADGSGLEVAFLGWWLVFGVELKRGAVALSYP